MSCPRTLVFFRLMVSPKSLHACEKQSINDWSSSWVWVATAASSANSMSLMRTLRTFVLALRRARLKNMPSDRVRSSPRHKHWPAGPAHFSDRRASSGQYIFSFTGPYGPPRYMSGHQISNSAGPDDDKSQDVLFARAPAPHLSSFRAVLLLQRDASVARVGVGHVNQTH